MNFLEFKFKFEQSLSKNFNIQLETMELLSSDDGGVLTYKINDTYIKLHWDLRDQWFYVFVLKSYPARWHEAFFATKSELLGRKRKKIIDLVSGFSN